MSAVLVRQDRLNEREAMADDDALNPSALGVILTGSAEDGEWQSGWLTEWSA